MSYAQDMLAVLDDFHGFRPGKIPPGPPLKKGGI
jgi:hypothetical protein